MHKTQVFLVLSVWLVLLPFLGFPYSWKDIMTTLSGLILVYLSYLSLKEEKIKRGEESKTFDNFSENHDFGENKSKNNVT